MIWFCWCEIQCSAEGANKRQSRACISKGEKFWLPPDISTCSYQQLRHEDQHWQGCSAALHHLVGLQCSNDHPISAPVTMWHQPQIPRPVARSLRQRTMNVPAQFQHKRNMNYFWPLLSRNSSPVNSQTTSADNSLFFTKQRLCFLGSSVLYTVLGKNKNHKT